MFPTQTTLWTLKHIMVCASIYLIRCLSDLIDIYLKVKSQNLLLTSSHPKLIHLKAMLSKLKQSSPLSFQNKNFKIIYDFFLCLTL